MCIPRVIDSCNLRLYQAVFNFCCSVVFCLVLSSRMSLFQKRLKLERSVSLKYFDFFFFDILVPFENLVVSRLLLEVPKYKENVLICVITVIKVHNLLLTLLQVKTIVK